MDAQSFYSKRLKTLQNATIAFGLGSSGYFGDLQDEIVIPFWAGTLDVSFRLDNSIRLRSAFTLYSIRASDSNSGNTDFIERNLSFQAVNLEWHVGFVFDLIPTHRNYAFRPLVTPFLFVGIGFSTNHPTTKLDGKRHALRPLRTEGVRYPGVIGVLPLGIGVRFKANREISVVSELGMRFTNSDYLDDVSTVYEDPQLLSSELTRSLADRSQEVGAQARSVGQIRGNPRRNDNYLIWTVKLEGNWLAVFGTTRKGPKFR